MINENMFKGKINSGNRQKGKVEVCTFPTIPNMKCMTRGAANSLNKPLTKSRSWTTASKTACYKTKRNLF